MEVGIMGTIDYRYLYSYNPNDLYPQEDVSTVLGYIYRNIIREDNIIAGVPSIPGAIIASPSVPDDPETDQNYRYDWTRDSALTMYELVSICSNPFFAGWKAKLEKVVENYIRFVTVVQKNSQQVPLGYARWNLDGTPSIGWSVQNDGPALRIITHIKAIEETIQSQGLKDQAINNIKTDLAYLVQRYRDQCYNIWEEERGDHFFTKKIIRKAFHECTRVSILSDGLKTSDLDKMISELEAMLLKHLEGLHYYKSNIASDAYGKKGNDKNIDVLFALLHGEINKNKEFAIESDKSMATVAELVAAFIEEYPINSDDLGFGLGPNMGRYPYDNYDGDTTDGYNIGHPWFISNNALSSFFYRIAALANTDAGITARAAANFGALYNCRIQEPKDIVSLGDRHILTTQRHWYKCHMSEQYDRNTGYLKSVRDLTWSYATYLMAYRLNSAV